MGVKIKHLFTTARLWPMSCVSLYIWLSAHGIWCWRERMYDVNERMNRCNGRMHVKWLNAPQWCAWQYGKKMKKTLLSSFLCSDGDGDDKTCVCVMCAERVERAEHGESWPGCPTVGVIGKNPCKHHRLHWLCRLILNETVIVFFHICDLNIVSSANFSKLNRI